METSSIKEGKAKVGTADFLIEVEKQRAIKVNNNTHSIFLNRNN